MASTFSLPHTLHVNVLSPSSVQDASFVTFPLSYVCSASGTASVFSSPHNWQVKVLTPSFLHVASFVIFPSSYSCSQPQPVSTKDNTTTKLHTNNFFITYSPIKYISSIIFVFAKIFKYKNISYHKYIEYLRRKTMVDYSPFWETLEKSTENWYTLTNKHRKR